MAGDRLSNVASMFEVAERTLWWRTMAPTAEATLQGLVAEVRRALEDPDRPQNYGRYEEMGVLSHALADEPKERAITMAVTATVQLAEARQRQEDLADLADRLTIAIRERSFPAVSEIRDRLDDLAGRPAWQLSDDPRPASTPTGDSRG